MLYSNNRSENFDDAILFVIEIFFAQISMSLKFTIWNAWSSRQKFFWIILHNPLLSSNPDTVDSFDVHIERLNWAVKICDQKNFFQKIFDPTSQNTGAYILKTATCCDWEYWKSRIFSCQYWPLDFFWWPISSQKLCWRIKIGWFTN